MARNIPGKEMTKFVILSPNQEFNPLKPGVQKKPIHT